MQRWENIFSRENVLRELCRLRLRLAARRQREALEPWRVTQNSATEPVGNIFPKRGEWHRFRPEGRHGISSDKVALQTLLRATTTLSKIQPTPVWAKMLDETICRIQWRALHDPCFRFNPPKVTPVPKEPGQEICRPICKFELEDAVINSLTSRYWRELIDPIFLPSCLAFRTGKLPVGRDTGVEYLLQFRQHADRPLYVAEVDLQAFYDCLDHDVARTRIHAMALQIEQSGGWVSRRAIAVVDAYLSCYAFPKAETISARNPKGRYAWPFESLANLHPDLNAAQIGIPQGGAISNLLVNVILHEVDEAMATLFPDGKSGCYLRYCDDMVIVAPEEKQCAKAFEEVLRILQHQLRLPVHPPETVMKYNSDFWEAKSRKPYRWCSPRVASDAPWVHFLGYQVRFDGEVRIAKKSLRRQQARILTEANRVLQYSAPSNQAGTRFLRRICNRLINLSVGKNGVRHAWPVNCWSDGFRLVHQRIRFVSPLKTLDRYREKNIRRILRLGKTRGWMLPDIKRKGFAYSYVARFIVSKKIHR